jgi:hypothetical protein
VEGCYDPVAYVCYEDWDAVCCTDAEDDSGQSGDEPVAFEYGLAIGSCELSFEGSFVAPDCADYR